VAAGELAICPLLIFGGEKTKNRKQKTKNKTEEKKYAK
jgi:hypothetical protein